MADRLLYSSILAAANLYEDFENLIFKIPFERNK